MNRSSVRFRQAALAEAQVNGPLRAGGLGFAHEGGKPMSRPTGPSNPRERRRSRTTADDGGQHGTAVVSDLYILNEPVLGSPSGRGDCRCQHVGHERRPGRDGLGGCGGYMPATRRERAHSPSRLGERQRDDELPRWCGLAYQRFRFPGHRLSPLPERGGCESVEKVVVKLLIVAVATGRQSLLTPCGPRVGLPGCFGHRRTPRSRRQSTFSQNRSPEVCRVALTD